MRKTEHHYRKDMIVKVELHLTVESQNYCYHPGRKFLGITLKKPGVYDNIWNKLKDIRDLPHHILLGDIVLRKPHVTCYFQGDQKFTKWFESDSEARKWAHNTYLKGGTWITEYT
jgi:hypothetical protein